MLKQARESIDVVYMSVSQMNITTKLASRINISKFSTCNQQPIIPRHREGYPLIEQSNATFSLTRVQV